MRDIPSTDEVEPEESKPISNYSDRPRKEGGGRGNVGNLKDEQRPEKYIKEGEEQTADVVVAE